MWDIWKAVGQEILVWTVCCNLGYFGKVWHISYYLGYFDVARNQFAIWLLSLQIASILKGYSLLNEIVYGKIHKILPGAFLKTKLKIVQAV